MKSKLYSMVGAVFTVLLGSLLHFTFEWSNYNAFVGSFSAVNESTWEHLKLLAIPMLIYMIFEYFKYGKNYKNFFQVKFVSILLGMFLIVASVYTFKGIFGRHFLTVDIIIFIISIFIAYWFSYKKLGENYLDSKFSKIVSIIGLIGLVVIFVVFTYYPPEINLFRDSSTGRYGIPE